MPGWSIRRSTSSLSTADSHCMKSCFAPASYIKHHTSDHSLIQHVSDGLPCNRHGSAEFAPHCYVLGCCTPALLSVRPCVCTGTGSSPRPLLSFNRPARKMPAAVASGPITYPTVLGMAAIASAVKYTFGVFLRRYPCQEHANQLVASSSETQNPQNIIMQTPTILPY